MLGFEKTMLGATQPRMQSTGGVSHSLFLRTLPAVKTSGSHAAHTTSTTPAAPLGYPAPGPAYPAPGPAHHDSYHHDRYAVPVL